VYILRRSVGRFVHPLVMKVNSGKMVDLIEMLFEVVDHMGLRNHVLDRGPNPLEKGQFQ